MTAARCERCGGLVTADAEWCGQCFAPLPRAAAPDAAPAGAEGEPPAAAGPPPEREAASSPGTVPAADAAGAETVRPAAAGGMIHKVEGRMVWSCPACAHDNPIAETACKRCLTPFDRIFSDPAEASATDPARAFSRSLLFPGLGHASAGRGAEGLARAVIFIWSVASVIAILLAGGGRTGTGVLLVAVYVVVAAGLYGLSAVDARRAAARVPPLIGTRALLFGSAGLMLFTLAVVVFSTIGAARS